MATTSKPPKKGGPPTKLNDHVQQVICDAIIEGQSNTVACNRAGISDDTLARWVKEKPAFAEAVACARSTWEANAVKQLQGIGYAKKQGDWRCLAYLLACRNPAVYSVKSRQEVTGADGGPITINLVSYKDK